MNQPNENNSFIAFPIYQGYIYCHIEEVIYCEADGNYTTIFLKDRAEILISKAIGQVEQLLESSQMVRIHQSFIVNIAHIQGLIKEDGLRIVLRQGVVLPVSPNKKNNLMDKFKTFSK